MTDREKAIVMAYTGVTMLKDDKLQIFYKYVEDIMGRPIWTHEMVQFADDIKEKSKDDFMALCADENLNEWTPVSERLPEYGTEVLTCIRGGYVEIQSLETYGEYWENQHGDWTDFDEVIAWMPLPKPYNAESEDKE